jgi:hypothetical protein
MTLIDTPLRLPTLLMFPLLPTDCLDVGSFAMSFLNRIDDLVVRPARRKHTLPLPCAKSVAAAGRIAIKNMGAPCGTYVALGRVWEITPILGPPKVRIH